MRKRAEYRPNYANSTSGTALIPCVNRCRVTEVVFVNFSITHTSAIAN